MKKLALMVLISTISLSLLANTLQTLAASGVPNAAYQLAEYYEQQNDAKQAMYWYKKSATLSLKHSGQSVDIDAKPLLTISKNTQPDTAQQSASLSLADNPQPNTVISDRLTMYQEYESQNKEFKTSEFSLGLRPYHANYILPITYDTNSHQDGRKYVETVFQLSFKKDIFNNVFGLNESVGVAYTQRNWWQITEESAPFRETNYLPELYIQIPNQTEESILKGSQFGFVHESNGQGNEAGKSRSWNRLYLEGYFQFYDSYFIPRVWYRIPESKAYDDNPDIADYLGYGDLTFFLPYKQNLVKVLLRNNLHLNDNRGAIQIDWSYPLWDTGLYGYVQYFNGYGESLIDYNKRTNRLGIGIALSR